MSIIGFGVERALCGRSACVPHRSARIRLQDVARALGVVQCGELTFSFHAGHWVNELVVCYEMNRQRIGAALRSRRSWLVACGLFPLMALATHVAVFPGNTKGGPHFWTLDGMTVVTVFIGLRMLVGLALAEKTWKAWFYFLLPIPFAVGINWLEGVMRNPPSWFSV